jgi:medium-chain acyl-[acyl-carrier-protein] hydrolase
MQVFEKQNLWLGGSVANAEDRLLLFCFPPAGGGTTFFRSWMESNAHAIQVCPVQLPGREHRMMEQPFSQLRPLVQALAQVIRPEQPFAFFGHSMGALISFELAREFRRQGLRGPLRLFVSAAPAPQLPLKPARYSLGDREFVDELRALGGTSELILKNAEILRYFMPMLRADFQVVDTYEYLPEEPLDCPIHVFGGDKDLEVPLDQLLAWREQTRAGFTSQICPGDHFYVQSIWGKLIDVISARMQLEATYF